MVDPVTRKTFDPKTLYPPKKKKKEPKFIIPEWAIDTRTLDESIKTLEGLVAIKDELYLDDEFLTKCRE